MWGWCMNSAREGGVFAPFGAGPLRTIAIYFAFGKSVSAIGVAKFCLEWGYVETYCINNIYDTIFHMVLRYHVTTAKCVDLRKTMFNYIEFSQLGY